MKTENENYKKNLTLSAIPTLNSENNRFSLCPDSYFAQGRFRNRTEPGRNSYFARQSENSYFVQDNSRIVPIPTLRRTYISINPLPHMAILGSTNSAANRDMMSKIWINGETII